MIFPDKVKLIAIGITFLAFLSGGFFIGRCTKRDYSKELLLSQELVKEKDKQNKLLESERGVINIHLSETEKENQELKQRDADITKSLQNSQLIYQKLNDKISSINTIVPNGTSSDSLRAIARKIREN